jgi:hypothetical protein
MWLERLYFLTFFAIAAPILVFAVEHPDDGWVWFGALVALGVIASYPNGVGWGFS